MEIVHLIWNSLVEAAASLPLAIYVIVWGVVVIGVLKEESIVGFRQKATWIVRYGFIVASGFILATAVARWVMPASGWVDLEHRIERIIANWISAQFEAHFWRSLIVEIMLFVLTAFVGVVLLLLMLGSLYEATTIQVPEPSGVYGTASIATEAELEAACLVGGEWGDGLRLGYSESGRPMRYRGGNSVAVIGPSGSGKNTDFLTFLMAEAGNKSMLLLDPACQTTPMAIAEARKRGPTIVIAPYKDLLPTGVAELLGPTDSCNVMDDLSPKTQIFAKKCDTIADTLITADHSGQGQDSGHFTEGARGVTSAVVMGVKLYFPAERANLAEVCNIICRGDEIFKFTLEMVKRGDPHVLNRLSTLTAPNAKQSRSVADILQTARLKLKFISDPGMHAALRSSPNWTWNDLKNGDRSITFCVCIPETEVKHCAPFMSLILTSAGERLLATPKGKHQVVIVADEFPLFKSDVWETLFSTGRKHGVQGFVCAQNYGQIEQGFGRLGASSLLSACGAQLYLAPRDEITADHISKLTGRRTVITRSFSYSQQGQGVRPGTNFGEQGQAVFDPHQVKALDSSRFFMFAPGLVNDVIIGRRQPYWLDADVLQRCGADPYHLRTSDTVHTEDSRGSEDGKKEDGGRKEKKKSFLRWLWEV